VDLSRDLDFVAEVILKLSDPASDPYLYVGFSRGRGMVGRAIRLFTGGTVNHAFLAWKDEHLGWICLGANGNGITPDTFENLNQTTEILVFVRPTNERKSLWAGLADLRDELNRKYNFSGIAGMAVVEIARHFGKHIDNPFSHNGEYFCSQFATEVVRRSGYDLKNSDPSNTIDPQEMCKALQDDISFISFTPVP
jgi:hypothetical protein